MHLCRKQHNALDGRIKQPKQFSRDTWENFRTLGAEDSFRRVCDWVWACSTTAAHTMQGKQPFQSVTCSRLFWSILAETYMRKGDSHYTQASTTWRELETKSICVQVCHYSFLLTKALYVPAWDNCQVLASLSLTDSIWGAGSPGLSTGGQSLPWPCWPHYKLGYYWLPWLLARVQLHLLPAPRQLSSHSSPSL